MQQKQQQRSPHHQQDDDDAFDQVEGKKRLRPLDEIRRNNDGCHQPDPGIVACPRRDAENDKQQQSDQENIGDLRITDARDRERRMHANVGATTQQISIVAHQDHGREADALAESLQQSLQHRSVSPVGARHYGLAFRKSSQTEITRAHSPVHAG
jgi:hypothetical protein